jgi:tetratricopeptide (TPR) repeat protein
VSEHAEALAVEPEATAWLLNETGQYLGQRADHQQARGLLERAVAIREAFLGVDHPATATSLHNLADVLYAQATSTLPAPSTSEPWPSTRPVWARMIASPLIASTASPTSCATRGDLRAARKLLERALAIDETRQGPDHLDTANSLHGLANVLHGQSDLDGARILHERFLAIYQAQLGADHPYTAGSLHGLAKVLADKGDLDGARTLYERALDIHQARLGLDHPHTAKNLTNLGAVLHAQGELEAGRAAYERTLSIRETRLGHSHDLTVQSRQALAAVTAELDRRQ